MTAGDARPGRRRRALRAVILGAAGAAVALALLAPALAQRAGVGAGSRFGVAGDHRGRWSNSWDEDWWDAWWDYNRTLKDLQRESISTQEEQSREAARSVRRNELEQSRERSATEREAYFDAILEASQASLRAPRGAYYRKPGYTSAEPPPPTAAAVEVGGISYRYDRGVFWLQQGTEYLVVAAPIGAVVGSLPSGAVRVAAGGNAYWYFFGAFFAERDGAYVVVRPPAGITVYYLPDGYTSEKLGDADVFRYGETLFRPVFVQGVLAYQVVAGS